MNLLIGIDPDCEKSGIATLNTKTNQVEVKNLSFFELLDYLLKSKTDIKSVRLEAGFLNSGNWHLHYTDSKAKAAAKGRDVGRNHEVARKIAEMLEYLGIKHELVKPTKHKMDNATLQQKLERLKITGLPKRTNAEMRDAVSLLI